ncbi:MAG: VWA domain-containing protein [Pyrinomonadaceae bacterium]
MLTGVVRVLLLVAICLTLPVMGDAQSARPRQNQSTTKKAQTTDVKQEPGAESRAQQDAQGIETLKIQTALVTVPVVATDRNGIYVPDLRQDEFAIAENGVNQQIAFFATISVPSHVVLMLDTSASTQEKLALIQQAAIAFVGRLQTRDRVKVISFDDQVRDLNDFTNDRAAVKEAISRTRSGQGTKLYDAFALALSAVRRIQGRKAIVLFTDGVDYHSDSASSDSTLRILDEEGVLVYAIRYNTREAMERMARQQEGPELPTIGVVRAPAPGAPTFPSDDPESGPASGTRTKTGPLGLPLPDEILRRRRESERDRDRDRVPNRLPPELPNPDRRQPGTNPNDPKPDPRNDPGPATTKTPRSGDDSTVTTSSKTPERAGDAIDAMLDELYLTADRYLEALSQKSGGRLLRADSILALPDAFAKIAAELRTQYSLGYYPVNKARDAGYRNINVSSTRKNVIIRARPGYRAPGGE